MDEAAEGPCCVSILWKCFITTCQARLAQSHRKPLRKLTCEGRDGLTWAGPEKAVRSQCTCTASLAKRYIVCCYSCIWVTAVNEKEQTGNVFRWLMIFLFWLEKIKEKFLESFLWFSRERQPIVSYWVKTNFWKFLIFSQRSYDKMLIDCVRSSLAFVHEARTSPCSARTCWPSANYFPVWPSHSVNK